jgi:hypothetical protein
MVASMKHTLLAVFLLVSIAVMSAQTESQVRTTFIVRYVVDGSVYLDGGINAGLAEGMKLAVNQAPAEAATTKSDSYLVALLVVDSVAATSAVCTVMSSTRQLKRGDVAQLSSADTQKIVEATTLSNTRQYPAVVSFTEGDPMDEDVRDAVPRPPLPEVNRAQGRIGLDYYGTATHGSAAVNSSNLGFVFRGDITRIAGTHWNLSGYWRGALTSTSSSAQPTIQDLLNRTYHIAFTYDNPDSKWVAGFGRMYLPWASSLETIDGGYIGRRLSHIATAGIFAGSTPDPTSWDYNPQQRIGGAFVNFSGGSYDALHYSSTTGFGLSMLNFSITRPFVFFENSVSYARKLSIYHSFQIDQPTVDPSQQPVNFGVGRSFLTVHYQVNRRIGLDFNHNYFRDVPTFDPTLIGTGLLDKYLFQGLSVATRIEGPAHLSFYVDVGRSSNSTDAKASWNEMYGLTLNRIWRTKLRVDARYSKFDSVFATGDYKSVSVSRNFGDDFRWEFLLGKQKFISPYSTDTGSNFIGSTADFSLGRHYFFEGGLNVARGSLQDYDQWSVTLGYRFDNRGKR